ncbi:MAG TPA: hypothetical protein VF665_06465 [Longimicrobium sp.]|jgi:hypothetical protein|uniref:hypothetical protein n=1 Tax=Longimicrobium sp. TaxID=2029185 RepID=UPI002ED80988
MRVLAVRLILAGLVAMGTAGCLPPASGPVPGTNEQQEVTLTLGQTIVVDGRVHVTFGRVGDDSRCPANVACVTAGNAVVSLLIQERGERSETLQINTHTEPRSATDEELRFEVVSLEPAPTAGQDPPASYTVRLRITRARGKLFA